MPKTLKPYSMITDFVTGKSIPNVGAEENRQMVERFLVAKKGYSKSDIEVGVDMEMTVAGETYRSQSDLVVSVDGGSTRFMAIKCAAASLGSREREILAAARLLGENQLPFSVVSDGKTAIVLDTVSGRNLGEGLNAILSKEEALAKLNTLKFLPFSKEKREREKLIFRSYDSMNVNVGRNI
ncbi:MAG: type I restriction enzyme HsdR N-terminal domain-containing protein [Desulfobacterales bacterium]